MGYHFRGDHGSIQPSLDSEEDYCAVDKVLGRRVKIAVAISLLYMDPCTTKPHLDMRPVRSGKCYSSVH